MTDRVITESYRYNDVNELLSVGCSRGDGEVNEVRGFTYDADGNMTSDGRGIYKYDSMNRMSEAVMEDGRKLKCRYDAEGLRHETEENGRLIKFIYSGRDAVCEEDEESSIRYIRGNGRLVASDSEQARTYYHYACDSLGSVSHVIAGDEFGSEEENADIGRRVLCRYEYDAFGNTVSAEENVTNRYGFAGEMRDGITGQYYLRARYYVPEIGRFTQADTYHGDGLNLYVYARNNPVKYVDPSGHNSKGIGVESIESSSDSTAKERRNSLGVVEGNGRNTSKMMYGTEKNAGVVPKEVADKLRGKQYNSFDEFRKDFWKAVAKTDYANEFLINGDPKNYYRMMNGGAPLVSSNQAINGSYTYQLHHIIPISQGGSVYSVDNLAVVTPRYHAEILIPEVHGYNGYKKYFR